MKVRLGFVPPGGGETDYSLGFELPAVPQAGDYIMVNRGEEAGVEAFIVRRSHWGFAVDEEGQNGRLTEVWVECEFADSDFASPSHKRSVDMYENRTGKRPAHQATLY